MEVEIERFLGKGVLVVGSIWILAGGWEPEGTPANPEQRLRDVVDAALPQELSDVVPWIRIGADLRDYASAPRRPSAFVLFAARDPARMAPPAVREMLGQIGVEAGLLRIVPAGLQKVTMACVPSTGLGIHLDSLDQHFEVFRRLPDSARERTILFNAQHAPESPVSPPMPRRRSTGTCVAALDYFEWVR
jgi:hypothetical protein